MFFLSPEICFSASLRIIFSPLDVLFLKRGTTVFQKTLLSVIFLVLRPSKYDFKVSKGPASWLKISLWGSSVSACANQPPGLSVSGTLTPNGLFQTINGLKRSVGYSKQLH